MTGVQIHEVGERIPISVLTGFLGSGKTTLLSRLLSDPKMSDTAVVINEFGDVGLDHVLVESSNDDVIVMDSGCLCCTIRSDLVDTLRSLFRRRVLGEVPEFVRLIIETTGLADPAPILHTLMTDPLLAARYRLDSVITTVDGVHGIQQMNTQFEPVKQAAVADRILITKRDLIGEDDAVVLSNRLRTINPAAPIHPISQGTVDADKLFGAGLYNPETKSPDVARWLQEEAYAAEHAPHHHQHDVNRHDDRIRSFCLTSDTRITWDAFADWMEALISTHGEALLRVKGILHVTDTDNPVAVHGVQHIFHPPAMLNAWPDDDRRSRIVMITRDLHREPVEQMFHAFMATQQP